MKAQPIKTPPLALAGMMDCVEAVKLLLDYPGIDVNDKNQDDQTVLDYIAPRTKSLCAHAEDVKTIAPC